MPFARDRITIRKLCLSCRTVTGHERGDVIYFFRRKLPGARTAPSSEKPASRPLKPRSRFMELPMRDRELTGFVQVGAGASAVFRPS